MNRTIKIILRMFSVLSMGASLTSFVLFYQMYWIIDFNENGKGIDPTSDVPVVYTDNNIILAGFGIFFLFLSILLWWPTRKR